MESIIAMLISALIAVESGGNPDAIGDYGKAVGVLQIRAECVNDVNRITGNEYTLVHRRSADKSREICAAYLKHYGRQYERITGKAATAETLARIWNGGPRGYRRAGTRRYWAKVQAELQRQGQVRADGRTLQAHRRVVTHSAWQSTRTYYRKRQ